MATIDRPIDNSDLWAAVRGLGMYRQSRADLQELIAFHAPKPEFASRVIAEAARQVLATRPADRD